MDVDGLLKGLGHWVCQSFNTYDCNGVMRLHNEHVNDSAEFPISCASMIKETFPRENVAFKIMSQSDF